MAMASICAVATCAGCACTAFSWIRCCFGSCCGGGSTKSASITTTRIAYVMQLFLVSVVALTLLNYGSNLDSLTNLPGIKSICVSGQRVDQCIGTSAVMRLSLGCTLYFAFMLPTALSQEAFAGWWAAKLLLFAGLVAGCFFMPANAIDQYGQVARGFSGLFLVMLAVLTVDFAYNTQDWFVARMDEADADFGSDPDFEPGLLSNKWRVLYLLLVFLCVAAAISCIVTLFVFATSRSETCPEATGFLSFTLVSGLVLCVLSPFELFGARGLLPPAVVWAYCAWLAWSSMTADPNQVCNPVPTDSTSTAATVVGMVVASCSLCYTAVATSRSVPGLFSEGAAGSPADAGTTRSRADSCDCEDAHSAAAPKASSAGSTSRLLDAEHGGTASRYAEASPAAPHAAPVSPPYSIIGSLIFLLTLVLASLCSYHHVVRADSAMVLTNWAVNASDVVSARNSTSSMWAQFGSEIAVVLLYTWTLVAPLACPGRDFS